MGSYTSWTIMFLLCVAAALLFGDEEAVIDMSDLGYAVAWSLGGAVVSVIFENVCRSLYGQFSENDSQTFLFAGSFLCAMVLYFGLIWFVFSLHVTSPLLIDGVESSIFGWFFADLLSVILLKTTLVWALLLLTWEVTLRLANTQLSLWSLLIGSLGLVTLLWVWVWDFLGSALQSSIAQNAQELTTPGGNTQSSRSYEYSLANSGFDWHAGACRPYVIYFTDLASLILCGLFIILALVTSVLTLINVFLISPDAYNNPRLTSSMSYINSLLDSSLVWVYMALILWVGTAVRIVLVHGFSWV